MLTRRKRLGNLGERLARALLHQKGFEQITDLNARRPNHPGGDFTSIRNGMPYFISVKARDKYQQNGRLNGGYNVYPTKVRKAAMSYRAVPAWVTIQIDVENARYSAYFGRIDELSNPNSVSVPMTPRAVMKYECLAESLTDPEIKSDLSNRAEFRPTRQVSEPQTSLSRLEKIATEVLGFKPGTKTHRAIALYLRSKGATTEEVKAVNDGPYLNCLKKVRAMGHEVRKSVVTARNRRAVTRYRIVLKMAKEVGTSNTPEQPIKDRTPTRRPPSL
ncbi:hypothetical protein [Mycoplana ramosa]|uniref:DUF4365 domain-containing protein n=1 Tax=Mycoplana ramosa TaxID=40837 RepID=A0ABW3YXP4_MYCRA